MVKGLQPYMVAIIEYAQNLADEELL